ncbi:hypothetical protein K0M31_003404 [Melipona bicolor]|uniref:Uncharacterized protein n=1 Tax=Melipona bicolor TaxID=60889 RepID=A0AA40FZK0_9HYME|nr:hypothetical protein K0M31_003404 [Melipona bicolor]
MPSQIRPISDGSPHWVICFVFGVVTLQINRTWIGSAVGYLPTGEGRKSHEFWQPLPRDRHGPILHFFLPRVDHDERGSDKSRLGSRLGNLGNAVLPEPKGQG